MLARQLRYRAAGESPALGFVAARAASVDLEALLDVRGQLQRLLDLARGLRLNLLHARGRLAGGCRAGLGDLEDVEAELQASFGPGDLSRPVELDR